MSSLKYKIIIFGFLFTMVSCKDKIEITNYQYTTPPQLSDGWEVASLDEVFMNEHSIALMMDKINDNPDHKIHSIVIVKDNKLVFEEYFENNKVLSPPQNSDEKILYDRDMEQFCASASKSILSSIFGVAVDKGLINSVDDKVVDYFPEYQDIMTGQKSNMTIKHLLTMTSGLPFDEETYPFGHPLNDVTLLFNAEDPIKWILEQPLDYQPGSTFFYNSGNTNVLAAIIEQAAGYSLEQFMDNFFFGPLGIDNSDYWIEVFSSGRFFVSGGFWMSPREICKIGNLYVNDGKWNGNQILSKEWIDEATKSQVILPYYISHSKQYGYQWWLRDFSCNGKTYPCIMALGYGNQMMLIFPVQDLIVQLFCGYFSLPPNTDYLFSLVSDYILKDV